MRSRSASLCFIARRRAQPKSTLSSSARVPLRNSCRYLAPNSDTRIVTLPVCSTPVSHSPNGSYPKCTYASHALWVTVFSGVGSGNETSRASLRLSGSSTSSPRLYSWISTVLLGFHPSFLPFLATLLKDSLSSANVKFESFGPRASFSSSSTRCWLWCCGFGRRPSFLRFCFARRFFDGIVTYQLSLVRAVEGFPFLWYLARDGVAEYSCGRG
mmetsp:Transcript_11670/g.28752  ORF Transcript_11670/g.28752 Transcript_11670/m.28752 type:complete len:214 (+) Transcript_11670:646-1287(+)